MSETPLNAYQSNVHSQNGEDGVISEILKRLSLNDANDNWCVEFGAWDGRKFSNTFSLVEKGWSAVYIEGQKDRFADLLVTSKSHRQIVPVNAFVARDREKPNSLDNILKRTKIPQDFSILSIDINSYDCDVWESLHDYNPLIVVIEINSSVPPGVIWRHSEKTKGNTFSATCRVAKKKGYTLVCHTGNLIFVRSDVVGHLAINQRFIDYPELLFQYNSSWIAIDLFEKRRSCLFNLAISAWPTPILSRIREYLAR